MNHYHTHHYENWLILTVTEATPKGEIAIKRFNFSTMISPIHFARFKTTQEYVAIGLRKSLAMYVI
jgi:hypothetical protein